MSSKSVALGRSPVTFTVTTDGSLLGELSISKGAVRWRSWNARKSRRVAWESLAELLEGPIAINSTPTEQAAPAAEEEGRHWSLLWQSDARQCPRCHVGNLREYSGGAQGCWYEPTHDCILCGFLAHQTVWPHRLLRDLDDLYAEVHVDGWEEFKAWAANYTDDMVGFDDITLPEGITTLSAHGFGQVFEFPGDLREIMADIQTAEDDERSDWNSFTDEAARRLIPVGEIYGEVFGDERDRMPDGWAFDYENQSWNLVMDGN